MRFLGTLRQQKLLSATLVVFTLSIGILIGTLINTAVRAEKAQVTASDATPLNIPNPTQLATAFTQLAKQLEPSVVNITSTYAARETTRTQRLPQQPRRRTPLPDQQQQQPQEEDDDQGGGMDLFRRFFGQDPFEGIPPHPFGFRRQGTGSGVVVDRNGYILTNFHVVESASRIQVKFNGETTEHNAKLVGSDPETDLAVLKVENGKKLVPARIGNSDGVQVGDWAVAIGSPFALEATVTAGIISALGRDLPGVEHQLQKFLQTDAAINPGNSGGPLLNIKGEVIGINTAIATDSGGYQGIGFALPVNLAVNVYNQIIKTGRVSRGSIGVGFQPDQKAELLRAYGTDHGVFVTQVEKGGPAEKAGVRTQDVIVSFNGQPVKDGDELVSRVSSTPVGSTATVTVLRDGKKVDLKLTIGERSEVWATRFRRSRPDEPGRPESSAQVKFGINIQDFPPAMREQLGFTERGGVRVTSVNPGSFGEDIGLLPRDVVMSINKQPVASVEDVQRIQGTLKAGDPVAFHVKRQFRSGARPNESDWQDAFLAGTLPANP